MGGAVWGWEIGRLAGRWKYILKDHATRREVNKVNLPAERDQMKMIVQLQ